MMHKLSRRRIDQIENILIALLACTALFLVGKTGMFQAVTGAENGQGGGIASSGFQGMVLSREMPVRLMTQTSLGRYGVQYDQTAADDLYHSGLDDLLIQTLVAMDDPKTVSQEDWQQAVTQGEGWIYYDFLYNVSFDSKREREGRLFLILAKNGRVEEIYYYNQETEEYYAGRIKEAELSLPKVLNRLTPNDGQFAFEVESLAESLPGYMMILPQTPSCQVYQVTNPLAQLDGATRENLLEKLDFNTRASSVYESADSTVIREGMDTLRLQKDGTVSFHGSDSGDARYQALSQRHTDLQIKAEEILDQIMLDMPGEIQMRCQDVETLADGSVELTFCYLLDGAKVQLWKEGWAARFVFQGANLTSFEICLRQYQGTEKSCAILPETQAAAAAAAMGQKGKELQLCYRDDGSSDEISAGWTVREPG